MEVFKNILVPIDFTPHSDNALQFAAQLAEENPQARLLIFHAFHVPVAITEMGGQSLTPYYEEEMKKSVQEKFKAREERLLITRQVAYSFLGEYGAAVPDVVELAEKHRIDLIVLPAHPGSYWEEYLGNVTTAVIERRVAPVLVVPENVQYRKPIEIVLATDCKGGESEKQLQAVKNIVHDYQAKLSILHTDPKVKEMSQEEGLVLLSLKDALASEMPELHLVNAEKTVEGIVSFLEGKLMGWLAVIPHEHGLFYRLLNKSTTNRLAFKTPVPMVVVV